MLILLLHLHFARMCITCITCITNLKRFVSLCSKQVRASSASASQGAYKAKLCSRFVQKRGKKICSYALVSTNKPWKLYTPQGALVGECTLLVLSVAIQSFQGLFVLTTPCGPVLTIVLDAPKPLVGHCFGCTEAPCGPVQRSDTKFENFVMHVRARAK